MAAATKFGIGLPNGFPRGEVNPNLFLEVAERAEEYGYDSVWAGDHIVFHVPRFEIFSTMAAVAVRTKRVQFGPAVLLLCLRNPVHVAQSVVTFDHMSGGRFVLGVGVGGEHPKEFQASGVPVNQRGARTNESLEVLQRLWTEPKVNFSGTYYQLDDIGMLPAPKQQPHPPIWVGGRSEGALKRAAKYGQAWAAAGEFLGKNYNIDSSPFARLAVHGTPDECIAHTRRYIEAGAEHVVIRFASFDPLHQIERWTKEVMPALR